MPPVNIPPGYDFFLVPLAVQCCEYLGNQYAFLYQGANAGDHNIHAVKSTDLGLTWTPTASVLFPSSGITLIANVAYTTCRDGNKVYLLGVDVFGSDPSSANSGPLLLYTYNLDSDTFSGPSSPGGAPVVKKYYSGVGSGFIPSGQQAIALVRRGPGDLLFLFRGAPESAGGNTYTRIYVSTFNGSSFGSPVQLAGQSGNATPYIRQGYGMDASGILHAILFGPLTNSYYHVAMNSAGSFGSLSLVESTAANATDTSLIVDFSSGGVDTIAFAATRGSGNGTITVYHAPGGTLNPTFTAQSIASTLPLIADPFGPGFECPIAIGTVGDLISVFWTVSGTDPDWDPRTGGGIIQSSQASTSDLSTWSANSTLMGPFDSPTGQWGASQVVAYSGPAIGLGVLGNFEGFNPSLPGGEQVPIELTEFIAIPPGGPVAPTIECDDPPDGLRGTPYSHTMPNTHTGAFTVSVTAGALPDGLTMNTSGVITGTPTVAGTFLFTATIADDFATGTASCAINIVAPSLGLGCANPPDGVVGIPYFHPFPVSGGIPPYTFAIIDGILPPGITLDAVTGQISGIPTLAGDYEFTIQVSDDFGSTVGTCDITITVTDLPGSGIDCGSPPAGEIGVPYSHTFPVTDIPGGATVVYSITGGALPAGLTLNTATGQVTGTPTTEGHYHFTVTATIT